MNMACTFCAQGRAAPAFYGTRNLPPVSADHAVRKQGRACNPRLLILGDQLLRETSAPPQPRCLEARKQGSRQIRFHFRLRFGFPGWEILLSSMS
jgi:hypothetical protein